MVRMSLPSAWFGAGAQSIFGLRPIFMLIPQPGVEGLTHLGKLSSYPKSIWSPGLWCPLIRNNCFVLLSLPRTQAETSINVCVVSLWQGAIFFLFIFYFWAHPFTEGPVLLGHQLYMGKELQVSSLFGALY